MSEIYDDIPVIPLGTYSGAGPIDSPVLGAHGATGGTFMIYAKTAGTSTVALRLVALTHPDFGAAQEAVLNVSKTVSGSSRFVWMFEPGVMPQPDGEAAVTTLTTVIVQTIAIALPSRFICRIEKGDTSAWELGVSLRRTP